MTDHPPSLFLGRAVDYRRGRQSYPDTILSRVTAEAGFDRSWVVADLGSGTGILTQLFLDRGNRVFAVEPNAEMRRTAESHLGDCDGFTSVAAPAEATTLADGTIDLVVSGQAFHHFDIERMRHELLRILRPDGCVLLCWNRFDTAAPAYEDFRAVQRAHALDPAQVKTHDYAAELDLDAVFAPEGLLRWSLANPQSLTLEQLEGLMFSLSFMPTRAHAGAGALIRDVGTLFERYAQDGVFVLSYCLDCFLWRRGVPVSAPPRR